MFSLVVKSGTCLLCNGDEISKQYNSMFTCTCLKDSNVIYLKRHVVDLVWSLSMVLRYTCWLTGYILYLYVELHMITAAVRLL
jgi:reverse gyrase